MAGASLPIESLPAWSVLNDVVFNDVAISETKDKGFGLVARKSLPAAEVGSDSGLKLLTVPPELVLNAQYVEQYAKEDKRFKQLLDAVGHQSSRGDVLLFLLAQLVIIWRSDQTSGGVSNPWTEYVRYLPRAVPLPTLWSDEEKLLLTGTSLETAVSAKLLALEKEFDELKDKSSLIPAWKDLLWEEGLILKQRDWLLLDSWYRSRSMELPRGGPSMVPCIDMVNHSAVPTASYMQNDQDGIDLCLSPEAKVGNDEEVTISYGASKSAAEMLFSYGFVDPAGAVEKLVLPMETMPDDPLAQAKLHIFGETPTVRVTRKEGGAIQWESPFAYLMCLNEEDGLEIRLLRLTDGTRQIKLFWLDQDADDSVKTLSTLTTDHPLCKVFQLRAVVVVQERLERQLQRLVRSGDSTKLLPEAGDDAVRPSCREAATMLRNVETRLLHDAINSLDAEKSALLEDKMVQVYLGSTEASQNDLAGSEPSNEEEEDFS